MADLILLDASDTGDDVARGDARPLALVEGGNPPSEYLMFGPGITETVKGPLLFDEEAAAAVMEFYESRGRKRIAGDWEHDSMVPAAERPPGYVGSEASHWFEPQVRPGPELWAVAVKWNQIAFGQISRGGYAHTSPVVKFQKSTGRIVAVLSCALTNDPATIGQPQLVAATAKLNTDTEKTMKFKLSADHAMRLKSLADAEHESPEDAAGKFKACLAEALPEHFGEKKEPPADEEGAAKMAEDVGAEEEKGAKLDVDKSNLPQNAAIHIKTGNVHDEGGKGGLSHGLKKTSAMPEEEKREMSARRSKGAAALVTLYNEVRALTGKHTVTAALGSLTAMKHASEDVALLTAKIKTRDGSAFEAVVEQGKKAMKFSPADLAAGSPTNRGKYIAAQRGKGEEGVLALTAYLAEIKPHATTTETAVKEAETADLSTVRLSAAEVESCQKNGIDQKEYLKNKQKRHADGDAPRFDAPR